MNRGTALRIGTFALAGALAGILVGGLGGRIVMRIAGAMSDPMTLASLRTANGNVLGEITLGGTLALAIFAGLVPGLVGGVAYGASLPWLVPLGRWSGAAFGLVLLAAIGPAVLEPFNFDFQKFGKPVVNVALFAALFPLFGLVVAAAAHHISASSRSRAWQIAAGLALAALLLATGLGLNALFSTLVGSGGLGEPRGLFLLWFVLVPVLLRLALDRGLSDARTLPARARVASYALLLAPAAIGLPATVEAMLFLAR